jgi:hypothetical protein
MNMNMNMVTKLERLAADLRLIESGCGPTAEELARAPLLLNWSFVGRPVVALEGVVVGHPLLGSQPIMTSQLYWVSDDKRCARTLSRFYQLSNAA